MELSIQERLKGLRDCDYNKNGLAYTFDDAIYQKVTKKLKLLSETDRYIRFKTHMNISIKNFTPSR